MADVGVVGNDNGDNDDIGGSSGDDAGGTTTEGRGLTSAT